MPQSTWVLLWPRRPLCDQSGTSSWLLSAALHADPQRTGFLNTTSVRVMDVQLGNLFGPYWNVSIIVTNASTTLLNLWHLRQSWSQKGAIYCTMGRKWVTGGSMTSGSVLPVKPGSCFSFVPVNLVVLQQYIWCINAHLQQYTAYRLRY